MPDDHDTLIIGIPVYDVHGLNDDQKEKMQHVVAQAALDASTAFISDQQVKGD